MNPRVIVNCAMSADGKIASREKRQVRISDEEDMVRVHRLRNECDAILVGVGTIIADDPSLLVKERYVENPNQPLRIVLDPKCRIPPDAKVLGDGADTIVVTKDEDADIEGAEILVCCSDEGDEGHIDLNSLLEVLRLRNIETILVEGGGETIWRFFRQNLVDEFSVFVGSMIIGGATSPTPVDGDGFLCHALKELSLKSVRRTEKGVIIEYDLN